MLVFATVLTLVTLLVCDSVGSDSFGAKRPDHEYCRQYTGDLCSHNAHSQIEMVRKVSIENCANLCKVVYQGQCQYYVYSRALRECRVFNSTSDMSNGARCDKIAGPDAPNITFCDTYDQPCKDFRASSCDYKGSILEDLPALADVETCQLACSYSSRCAYFVYDQKSNNCTLLNSRIMECDEFSGTPLVQRDKCAIPTCDNKDCPHGDMHATASLSISPSERTIWIVMTVAMVIGNNFIMVGNTRSKSRFR